MPASVPRTPNEILRSGEDHTFTAAQTFTGGVSFTTTAISSAAAATFTGGITVTTAGITITDVNIALGTTTGTKIGTAVGQKLAFWNVTPVVQPAHADQAAVVGTAATSSTPFGFSEAQANAIVTLLNRIRTDLIAVGIIKGSA